MARIHAEKYSSTSVHQRDGMIENCFYKKDIISIKDLSLQEIQYVLAKTTQLKNEPQTSVLQGKIVAHCFFEPSTRTRLSFEAATLRLGGKVLGFSSDEHLSIQKGETLHDTIRVIAEYVDAIVIRHRQEGAARLAAEISAKPIINAGDGANQHPTQALVDLFTIYECQQQLSGLAVGLVGDLKYGRALHSFIDICSLFHMRLFLVAPEALTLPETICDVLKKKGIRFSFHQSIEEVISKVDILYMTRLQQERLSEEESPYLVKPFVLTKDMLHNVKPNLKILHPLPRVNEIEMAVDGTTYAHYFHQAANGVYVRQALLASLLTKGLS